MQTIDFYPYPFILGLLILLFVIIRSWKRGWLYLSVLAFFGIYLLAVICLIVFPILLPQHWPAYSSWNDLASTLKHQVHLIPFKYGNWFYTHLSLRYVFWEIAGNILLTIPFGFVINLLSPRNGRRMLWVALATGLALEGMQLLIVLAVGPSLRSVDINDVLLNALGVLTGYSLYRATVWMNRHIGFLPRHDGKHVETQEELIR